MDRQSRDGGEPAAFRGGAYDMDLGRAINDVANINAETCDAEQAQSEYYPDKNNSMERALGRQPEGLQDFQNQQQNRRRSETE
ncbi:uncharacterized protein LOC129596700 [Paramacrobiotus metropolitanus]|uniref:uncharacterized protein LOC129596700 n=1 Tax=Paramacrobiotus metropolitanus TaxID=2943436 RepID=UPI002445C480|nr:uncharacterized protein LOC129596700 [Paramacrobiotus metropolitanus]